MNTKVEEFTEAEKLAKLMEWSKAKEAAQSNRFTTICT